MTNQELIDHLKQFPPDAQVIYTCYSDYNLLTADEVTLIRPDEKGGIVVHNGHVMRVEKGWLPPPPPVQGNLSARRYEEWMKDYKDHWGNWPGEPEFLTCVHFPGN